MNRRAPSRRRAALGAALAVAVLATASCQGSPLTRPAAARVNGTEIKAGRVFSLLKALRHNLEIEQRDAQAAHQTVAPANLPTSLLGDSAQSWNMASFGRALQPLIEDEVLRQALRARGVQVTAAETKEATDALSAQLGGVAKLKTRDAELVAFSIRLTAEQLALRDALLRTAGGANREQQLQQLYERRKADLAEACLNVIVAPSQAAAVAARRQIDGGASFTAVTKLVSTDPSASSGGDVGCLAVASLATQLKVPAASFTAGAVIGPIQVQGSWDLIKVRSQVIPTYAQARATLDKAIAPAGSTETQAEVARLLATDHIWVDPRYGSWDGKKAIVVAPDPGVGPAPTTSTPTTIAATPGTG